MLIFLLSFFFLLSGFSWSLELSFDVTATEAYTQVHFFADFEEDYFFGDAFTSQGTLPFSKMPKALSISNQTLPDAQCADPSNLEQYFLMYYSIFGDQGLFQCQKIGFVFGRRIQVSYFTHLYGEISPTQQIVLGNQVLNFEGFLNKPLLPQAYYLRRFAHSLEEGKEFYPFFNNDHLSKNLSFYNDNEIDDSKIVFYSLQRSGTHTFARTLSELLGEFVGLFPYSLQDPSEFLKGEMVNSPKSFRLLLGHHFRDQNIRTKSILSQRNYIKAFDSSFHVILHRKLKDETCIFNKALPGYDKEDKFKEFLLNKTRLANEQIQGFISYSRSKLFVRYEDLLNEPVRTLETLLLFINEVPPVLSHGKNAVEKFYKENGLVSSYFQLKEGETKKSKLLSPFKRYHRNLIFEVFREMKKWIYFFDYQENYQKILEKRNPIYEKPNEYETLGIEDKWHKENQKNLEALLKHKVKRRTAKEASLQPDTGDLKKSIREAMQGKKDYVFWKYINCDFANYKELN